MKLIINKNKVFYCPLKANRNVDDSQGERPYRDVSNLDWLPSERQRGKLVKLHKFLLYLKVRLLRPGRQSVASTDRTKWLTIKNLSQDSAQKVY